MVSLQAPAGITKGKKLFSSLFLKAGAMFVEKEGQAEKESPEANDGSGPHQLVVVGTQQVFDVLEEDLDVPADGEDVDHRLGVGIEQGGPPVASHLRWVIQAEAGDQHQGGPQLTHQGADCVDIDDVATLLGGPDDFFPVFRFQRSGILGQADPSAAAILGDDTHLPVALKPSTTVPLLGRLAHPLAVIPGVDQEVGMGAGDRLELLDGLHRQIYFAAEGDPFPFAHGPLSIQSGFQRAAAAKQDIQAGKETMPWHHLLLGSRIVPAQAAHLLSLGLGADRIVEDQETCHYGFPGTPPTLRLLRLQAAMFGPDQWLHLFPEPGQPGCDHLAGRPRPDPQEARKAGKADRLSNAGLEPLQSAPPLLLDQPQQYGNEVLPLAPTEARAEDLQKLAQDLGQTYNRLGHGSPRRQGLFDSLLSPKKPCPLLCCQSAKIVHFIMVLLPIFQCSIIVQD